MWIFSQLGWGDLLGGYIGGLGFTFFHFLVKGGYSTTSLAYEP